MTLPHLSTAPDPVPTSPPPADRPRHDEGIAARLRAVTGRGSDARGAVTVELDATGAMTDLQLTSTAMDGNKATLERSIREAHAAAREAVDAQRAELVPVFAEAARSQVGDLVGQARSLQATAQAQLDKAVAAVAAAAARATEGPA